MAAATLKSLTTWALDSTDPHLKLLYDFEKDKSLTAARVSSPDVTHSNTTTVQTFFNSSGVLTTVSEANEPRFDYNPVTGASLGLLSEQAATNLALHSEDFSHSAWAESSNDATVSTNTTVAPDGTTTADTLEDSDASNGDQLQQNFTVVDDTTTHTCSFFIKKDAITSRFPAIRMRYTGGTGLTRVVKLNTSTGETNADGTPTSFGVIDVGDYWRLWIAQVNNNTGNTALTAELFPAYTASAITASAETDATGSIIAWGGQLENTSDPTGYILTTTATVTRNIDVNVTDSISWYNFDGGTFYVKFRLPIVKLNGADFRYIFDLSDNSDGNRSVLYIDQTTPTTAVAIGTWASQGASWGINKTSAVTSEATTKAALGFREDDVEFYWDGTTVGTDTSANLPQDITKFNIGQRHANDRAMCGTTAVLAYFNRKRTTAFMDTITT